MSLEECDFKDFRMVIKYTINQWAGYELKKGPENYSLNAAIRVVLTLNQR